MRSNGGPAPPAPGLELEPVIILGPTGVGKTAVAVEVARRLGGEIISADSRCFYRGLEVGTAKPTLEQRRSVPHHLLDIRSPEERYDVAEFRRDVARLIGEIQARGRLPLVVGGSTLYIRGPEERYDVAEFRRDVARLIGEIQGRGRLPLVVGGSTLYIQALVGGLFPGPKADPALRRRLLALPIEELYIRLKEVDPQAAQRIKPQDRQRLVRALEVYELTGLPISALQRESEPFPYSFRKFGLTMDRKKLYERLDARVEEMLAQGLIEEARELKGRLNPEMPAYRTIGYEEAFAYLDGALSLEETVRLIKRNTRRLAKRQLTFFKRLPSVRWLDVTGRTMGEVAQELISYLTNLSSA